MNSLDLLQRYQSETAKLFSGKKTVLLAVSGGLDSVVLAHLTCHAGIPFGIAHCNFQLRGEESARDEKFVSSLAASLQKKIHVKKFDTAVFAAEHKLSTQEAARKLRYEWFRELEKEFGYECTVTAHHADDNVETVLMNFFRGTGIKGLTGIPSVNVYGVHIVRPLLSFRRASLKEYAAHHHLQWVEDSSNSSSDYTRNLFRNEVLPLIKKAYPEAEENVLRNIVRFQKTNEAYELFVNETRKKLLESQPSGDVHVPLKKLLAFAHTSIPFEIFSAYGFSEKQAGEIMSLSGSQTGKFVSNNKWQVIRHRNMLVVAPVKEETGMIAVTEDENRRLFQGGALLFTRQNAKDFKLVEDSNVAQLDAAGISWPLILRKWRPGDYFYPLGLRKKKKIARFFIDQKLSRSQKENAWVIESGQKIIWIVGMRIDDRLKLTPRTKEVLVIRYEAQ